MAAVKNDLKMLIIFAIMISMAQGYFDKSFALLGYRTGSDYLYCYTDENLDNIEFSTKMDTGNGVNFRSPAHKKTGYAYPKNNVFEFGAFQCNFSTEDRAMEIVSLMQSSISNADLFPLSAYVVANTGDTVHLDVKISKKLELPIKWLHNGHEVPSWNDRLSVKIENVQTANAGIYECFYEGRRSIKAHALMKVIVRKCKAGMYGEECYQRCPPCYNGGVCHDRLGLCVCPAGFTGTNCEEACPYNYFGVSCSYKCGGGCAKYHFCKPDPFGCTCGPGLKGFTCSDPCSPGWYGADCKQPCHCAKGPGDCNAGTGACEGGCAKGWHGNSCQIEDCKSGWYGPHCDQPCHCANGPDACDPATGACTGGCAKGWSGHSCHIEGYFDESFALLGYPTGTGHLYCYSDENLDSVEFSTKADTGNGVDLKSPAYKKTGYAYPLNNVFKFGAFQCNFTREDRAMEIVTLMQSSVSNADLYPSSAYIEANTGDTVNLDVKIAKKLELRIKWLHNGHSIPSWTDQLRAKIENVQTSDAGIYECFYEGRRGTKTHALMKLIVRKCKANMYGEKCEKRCPPCYNGGVCHDSLGLCICPAGFTGPNCGEACPYNYFGFNCSYKCGSGCAYYHFCKPDPYGCTCGLGYEGYTCSEPCIPGLYGADCKQPCHCANGPGACDMRTGACTGGCAKGWRGNSCQIKACSPGSYGADCNEPCHCANGPNACDGQTGECAGGCDIGWTGNSCHIQACNPGWYGAHCDKPCHCANGPDACDAKTGACTGGCAEGWTGSSCHVKATFDFGAWRRHHG